MSTVNITVNGNIIAADTEKTLLDNLLENGIFVPHLCHNKFLESYGGCGLCLVQIEGMRRPLRACSTSVSDGMVITTSTPDIEKSRKAALELMVSDHTGDCKAPCFFACPTHQDVQGYVGLIAQGRHSEAIEVIKRDNPLPASIGRVCPHPCEKECRRGKLEGAVSICSLKRFAADMNSDYVPACKAANGKSVAVVGAGPAGLSCAYFLALEGYAVTVFEAQKKAGGMLRYGIPEYRLPKKVLDGEITLIEKLGVKFEYEKKLGKDFTVKELSGKYEAVFAALGAWSSSKLGCPGDDAEGVVGGIDMLYRVANGEKPALGNNVAVVGGGNTAIDAARTAVRLGAENVTIIYRRTRGEMPAEIDEIRDAEDEGVKFRFLQTPVEVVSENGIMKALKLQKMALGEPDASGRRKPVPVEGDIETVEFSTVIAAIGQRTVAEDVSEFALTAKGTVETAKNSSKTSLSNVFAAGDMVNKGADIAVRAIAGGKNAAREIDCYITGKEFVADLPDYSVNKNFDASEIADKPKIERAVTELLPVNKRKSSFVEAARTFTEAEALKEASRCLECGCASVYECELLKLGRAYGAFNTALCGKKHESKKDESHPFIVRDNKKCILCAQCVRACREISHTENLGLFGRGFGTEPISAFDLPLNDSKCISCGACVNVCPTGALTTRTGAVKNPPLPFEESEWICPACNNKCVFTKRTVNGRAVRMIPADLNRSCSIGVFGLPYLENNGAENAEIMEKLRGDTKFCTLSVSDFDTAEKLRSLLK